jgi:N-glycosylase/DNA lyase
MEQEYVLDNCSSFEPKHIFECGQCFRWDKEPDESYTGIFRSNVINVKKENGKIFLKGICEKDIKETCEEYFDLSYNYSEVKEKLNKVDTYLKRSIEYGFGIRILNQDLWETLISFIISANNNIPRIKGIIERISKEYGKEIIWNGKTYYTFPSPEELSKAKVEDLRRLGLGFRDVRVYETTKMVNSGEISLQGLQEENDVNQLRDKLLLIPRRWS